MLLRHPAVAEASVIAAPHAVKGEVRRIDFVDELPLKGPGKIDRRVVQRMMRERYGALG